ncbi:polysaccharide pyruvyl transferase family protein [Microbacterium karelineae]|uniref:polysaccharide pyruvyl transferase family protein n=1 Tax=Microbacterium karelineae TaxID=2654283 RepID=UPI0018D41012|nr:polysaccharide pyruvyl transferase family protein [Microbacterium karelineae]
MAKKIKRLLAVAAAHRAMSVYRQDKRFRGGGPALVFAPAAHGSFGDEALVLGTGAVLGQMGSDWSLVAPGDLDPWRELGVPDAVSFEDGLAGSGAMWSPPAADDPFSRAVVIGADGADFSYGIRHVSAKLSTLNLAAASGAPATLFNFSLRKSISREGAHLLRRLNPAVRICARDPFSQERAREVFGREDVSAAPDVGIFLTPAFTEASSRIAEWADGRRTAALTINNHLGVNFSSQDMLGYFRRIGERLQSAGFDVLVLAHDIRARQGDPDLARAVSTALGAGAISAVPGSAREAKAILAAVDLHVTSRMHAGVASLSQAVPTIGLDYVDKFRGQFTWYGAGDSVVPWDADDVVDQVAELVDRLSRDDGVRASLAAKTQAWKSQPEAWRMS